MEPDQLWMGTFTSSNESITPSLISDLLEQTGQFARHHSVIIQYFDSSSIHGHEHIISALYHALRAEATGKSRTRDLSVDIARFTAGERQIRHAFEKVGIKDGTENIMTTVFFPFDILHRKGAIIEGLVHLLNNLDLEAVQIQNLPDERLDDALERMAMIELKL